ncbi:MAG: DUF4197 domain-containing protein [Saprospiraceae bacterium]|nr:DUF4197 domain-containing protein [Saprospiraceae bacterium]
MRKQISALLIAICCFSFTSCEELGDVIGAVGNTVGGSQLTDAQIAEGLKQALKQGTTNGVNILSAKDGFFKNAAVKVLFPPEAQKVEKTLRDVGAGSLVDKAVEKLNRAAEDAAVGAKDIFVNAITQMTITDAMNILMGEKNACTNFLRKTTSNALYSKFNPVIKNSLNKVGANQAWSEVFTRYNKIPFVQKVNTDLDDHVTNKAMDGVFHMIEKEEGAIRQNPAKRLTDLMKKVFAKQDK